jgi:hypothetical protein
MESEEALMSENLHLHDFITQLSIVPLRSGVNVISTSSPKGVVEMSYGWKSFLLFFLCFAPFTWDSGETWNNQNFSIMNAQIESQAKQIAWDNCEQEKQKPLSSSSHRRNMSPNEDINFNKCLRIFLLILYKHISDIGAEKKSRLWSIGIVSTLIYLETLQHFLNFAAMMQTIQFFFFLWKVSSTMMEH